LTSRRPPGWIIFPPCAAQALHTSSWSFQYPPDSNAKEWTETAESQFMSRFFHHALASCMLFCNIRPPRAVHRNGGLP
jgi:hypothetical protein